MLVLGHTVHIGFDVHSLQYAVHNRCIWATGCMMQVQHTCVSIRSCYLPLQDGLIINIGSIAGLEPMKSTPVYAASKWGLRGWSLSCYDVSLLSASDEWYLRLLTTHQIMHHAAGQKLDMLDHALYGSFCHLGTWSLCVCARRNHCRQRGS